jgi:hypothetical protein
MKYFFLPPAFAQGAASQQSRELRQISRKRTRKITKKTNDVSSYLCVLCVPSRQKFCQKPIRAQWKQSVLAEKHENHTIQP